MNNKTMKICLSAVMVCIVVLVAVLFSGYLSESRDLSSLKKELSASTDAWKKINEEKLVVQKDLKEAKNQLREAELTISESEERAAELEAEIKTLEKEIEALKE